MCHRVNVGKPQYANSLDVFPILTLNVTRMYILKYILNWLLFLQTLFTVLPLFNFKRQLQCDCKLQCYNDELQRQHAVSQVLLHLTLHGACTCTKFLAVVQQFSCALKFNALAIPIPILQWIQALHAIFVFVKAWSGKKYSKQQ